jgi:hypothetical protein
MKLDLNWLQTLNQGKLIIGGLPELTGLRMNSGKTHRLAVDGPSVV